MRIFLSHMNGGFYYEEEVRIYDNSRVHNNFPKIRPSHL